MADTINDTCSGWCGPTIIASVFAGLGLIGSIALAANAPSHDVDGNPVSSGLVWLGVFVGWLPMLLPILLYYFLCKYCHNYWAWGLFLAPFIIGLVFVLIMISMIGSLANTLTSSDGWTTTTTVNGVTTVH